MVKVSGFNSVHVRKEILYHSSVTLGSTIRNTVVIATEYATRSAGAVSFPYTAHVAPSPQVL